jgi:hypothetical protein
VNENTRPHVDCSFGLSFPRLTIDPHDVAQP